MQESEQPAVGTSITPDRLMQKRHFRQESSKEKIENFPLSESQQKIVNLRTDMINLDTQNNIDSSRDQF